VQFQPHSPPSSHYFLGCTRKIGQTHRIAYIDYWMQLLVLNPTAKSSAGRAEVLALIGEDSRE